jgi:hypothetical protein
MSKKRKSPQTVEECGPSQKSNRSRETSSKKIPKLKPLGKLDNQLRRFASGKPLHCLQAARDGDTCLHTTVADLQRREGIYFDRQWVKVRNRFGTDTLVKEYWLSGENLIKARKLSGLEVSE